MKQFYRASNTTSAALLIGALGLVCLGSHAWAQSAGALATSPYVPFPSPAAQKPAAQKPALESCPCAPTKPGVAADAAPKAQKPAAPFVSGGQVLPIVMFRGTPAAPLPKPAYVSLVPVPLSLPPVGAQPAPTAPAAAPPVAAPILQVATAPSAPPPPAPASAPAPMSQAKAEKPAGPFKRIWRDTKKSVIQDVPEALADALPWVDRGQKDEPIEQVLARVSADLSRASARDPEWINPAESELRELSKRLSTLAEPPADGTLGGVVTPVVEVDAAGRPFRPRPIWPGASGRPETQSRPTALVTGSTIQQGPEAIGQRLPPPTDWVEEEETASKPPPQQVVAKRAKRPSK